MYCLKTNNKQIEIVVSFLEIKIKLSISYADWYLFIAAMGSNCQSAEAIGLPELAMGLR